MLFAVTLSCEKAEEHLPLSSEKEIISITHENLVHWEVSGGFTPTPGVLPWEKVVFIQLYLTPGTGLDFYSLSFLPLRVEVSPGATIRPVTLRDNVYILGEAVSYIFVGEVNYAIIAEDGTMVYLGLFVTDRDPCSHGFAVAVAQLTNKAESLIINSTGQPPCGTMPT
jgi:hypothetical protein